jgi:hypothetical protein
MGCNAHYSNGGETVVENNTNAINPLRAPVHTTTLMRREICNYIRILAYRHVEFWSPL